MFFLARSVFCIGLVAYLLPASGGQLALNDLAETARSAASDPMRALCKGDVSSCAEAGVAKLVLVQSLGSAVQSARPRSVDTLAAGDFAPAWRGPAPRS